MYVAIFASKLILTRIRGKKVKRESRVGFDKIVAPERREWEAILSRQSEENVSHGQKKIDNKNVACTDAQRLTSLLSEHSFPQRRGGRDHEWLLALLLPFISRMLINNTKNCTQRPTLLPKENWNFLCSCMKHLCQLICIVAALGHHNQKNK